MLKFRANIENILQKHYNFIGVGTVNTCRMNAESDDSYSINTQLLVVDHKQQISDGSVLTF